MPILMIRTTMKKTFYYNLFPTMAEEEACKASNAIFRVTRALVEIRDYYEPPAIDPENPWQIKKRLTRYEVVTGKLFVSFNDVFDHIFRHRTMKMANHVVLGHKLHVTVWDVSEENNPKEYRNHGTFMEVLPNDDYVLACSDLMDCRRLCVDDEIGLSWDARCSAFQVKVLTTP